MDKDDSFCRERADPIGQVFPFHDADVLQSGDRVITQLERLPLDASEPGMKAREIERVLLAGID